MDDAEVEGAEAIERAAGDDEAVPRASGAEAWQAVEDEIRLANEPWWEADGAPPPYPEDRAWHEREDVTEARSRRSSPGSGPLGWWRALDDGRRTLLLALFGLGVLSLAAAANLLLLAL